MSGNAVNIQIFVNDVLSISAIRPNISFVGD